MKKVFTALQMLCFYLLSFSWGILLTVPGIIAAIGLIISGHKPRMFYQNIYFEVGKKWRGISLGIVFIAPQDSDLTIKQHLAGHGIQNIILGVFMPIIITIPSMLRCALRKFKTYEAKRWFAIVLFVVTEVLAMALCTVGYFVNIDLMHVICCLIVYILPLFVWFIAQELPQYQRDDKIVPYEQVYMEKTATLLGRKFYK